MFAIVARKKSGLHCTKPGKKIMTLVWRRGIRATHKKILYFTKEYGEEDAFLPRKCKGDKFLRLIARKKSGLHCAKPREKS